MTADTGVMATSAFHERATAIAVAVVLHGIVIAVLVVGVSSPPMALPVDLGFELVALSEPQPEPAREAIPPTKKTVEPVQQPEPALAPAEPETTAQAEREAQAYVPPSAVHHQASNPRPVYPRAARRRGMQGRVVLQVWVTEQGRVQNVVVKQSCGYTLLDESAVRAVRQWRFQPATQLGAAMAATVEIPIRFRLESGAEG